MDRILNDHDMRFDAWKYAGILSEKERPGVQANFEKAGLALPEGPLAVINLHNGCVNYMNADDVRSTFKIAATTTQKEYENCETNGTRIDLTKAHQLEALEQAAEALGIDLVSANIRPAPAYKPVAIALSL